MSDPQQLSTQERERGTQFAPRFDSRGLITAVVVDEETKDVLVVAHMNAEALALTRETGRVHFWSRSRGKLWLKGETSGHYLNLREIWVDCDQDALVILAEPAGPTCHTGEQSCFYRRLDPTTDDSSALVKVKT
ncbi:phosphoribosyl-AMP cyclohydrolase [Erythrobacter sp. JL475]|nr:phosphoribosyl-AMP cyclohydrolase [Erythrobacter sp. JL475]